MPTDRSTWPSPPPGDPPSPRIPALLRHGQPRARVAEDIMRLHAATVATASGEAVEVWRHVGGTLPGGKRIMPSGRLILRPASSDPPKHGCWERVETVQPESVPPDPACATGLAGDRAPKVGQ